MDNCCPDNPDNDTYVKVTEYRNLSFFNISSPAITNIPHLTDADVDINMPFEQNFNYYSTHDFHSYRDIIACSNVAQQSFSALQFNIRSLAANYDQFINMLSDPFNWAI